jgi:hypothetical protein
VLGPFQVLKPPLTLWPKQPVRIGSPTATPFAWWKLDEAGGETAANAAGTNLIGRLHGQPRWAPDQGRHQGAIELDGVSNWIECADSTDLGFRDSFSVSVWIKPRAASISGDTLMAKGNAWELRRLEGTGELEFAVNGPQTAESTRANTSRVVCKRPLANEQWHHVAAIYDGKRIALYIDGREEDSLKASGPTALNNLPLTVGDNAARRGQRWNGWLDDVRLYDRSLSIEEIKLLHRNGS